MDYMVIDFLFIVYSHSQQPLLAQNTDHMVKIISACFTLFGHQVVACAHEASSNEPFSEPICWKASMLHEASSRHH